MKQNQMLIVVPLIRFTSANISGNKKNPVLANNLPYDIDDKYVYVLPRNKFNHFESAKDR